MNLSVEIRPELWEAISKPYESALYKSAIVDALHFLSNALRERANVEGDGPNLVGQALGGDSPRLRINKMQTQTEKDEQRGLEQMLRGIYLGIRNPRSHEQHEDSQSTANAIILFVDYILGIIGQAKEPFMLEEWKDRVFDPDFVASDRYANLLAAEVPPKKCTDALITLYRNKVSGDGKNLRYIFKALIERASDSQVGDFLSVVSDELKVTQEDLVIKTVLQILPAVLWPRIDEVARLRIENKLIRSIASGKRDRSAPRSTSGWLGTWARDFIQHFTLKAELYQVFLEKLRGSEEDKNYIGEYFWAVLSDVLEKTTNNYRVKEYASIIAKTVIESPTSGTLRKNLPTGIYNFPPEWRNLIIENLEPLKESDPEYYRDIVASQDVPF